MALRLAIFVLASFLLLTTRVSSNVEEAAFMEAEFAKPPAVAPAPVPLGPYIVKDWRECPGPCKERCKLHSRQNLCNRVCKTCCSVCKCVPPGTAGNREMCGTCYTAWLTHRNRTKCP